MKPRKKFRGIAYNCVVNRKPFHVYRDMLQIKKDHSRLKFVVLIESNQYDDEIADVWPGYREICFRKGNLKGKNTRLLIKKRWYEKLEVNFIHCDEPWTGPKDGIQPGRIFPVGILGRGKKRLVIIGIHMAWNGNNSNNAASREERRKINNYIDSLPKTYSVLMPGDWNRGRSVVADYIEDSRFDILDGTHKGVDHTGAIDVEGTALLGVKYGSDHPLQFIEAKCVN